MSSYNLTDEEIKVSEEITKLRTNPSSFNLDVLKEQRKQESFKLSPGLCKAARLILDSMRVKRIENITPENLLSYVREFTSTSTSVFHLAYRGKLDNMIEDLLEEDKNLLLGNYVSVYGMACETIQEELTTVIVFADRVKEGKVDKVYLPEHYSEFKEAFDLLDIMKVGKIDCKEIKKTMIDLGFHNKSPAIYSCIDKLDCPELLQGADFNTFMDVIFKNIHDNTPEGLTQIFLLFRDDIAHNTISLKAIRRIAVELQERDMVKEIDSLLKMTKNDVNLSQEEFIQFLTPELTEQLS